MIEKIPEDVVNTKYIITKINKIIDVVNEMERDQEIYVPLLNSNCYSRKRILEELKAKMKGSDND